MEEQAYSQANTREPIQVIDVDGWRSSIRHYEDLGESFDSQVSIYVAVAHQTSPQHQTLKKPAQLALSWKNSLS